MASDDSRPKVRMLFTIGVVAVFLLLGIKFVLDSYYFDMTETYEHTLIPPTTLRDETKKEQLDAIDKGQSGTIPVSVAMQMLESPGRDNASPVITPEPSEDLDPLKGWAKLKHEVHLPPQTTTATPQGETAPPDAGAPHVPAGDAGAAHPNAPHPEHTGTQSKDGGK